MRLEEILKAQGWSDQELTESPLLKDQRFRESLERSYAGMATERDQFKTEAERWADWREKEANPAIVAAEEDARKARLDAAQAREMLNIAKEYGYIDDEKIAASGRQPNIQQPGNQQPTFDESKFVTRDFANQFALGQGRAMAQYVDISNEHQRLFGTPLESFENLYTKLQNVSPLERGKVSIRDIWERENRVPEKRAEISAASQAAHDKKIRDEATAEVERRYATQRANPLMASPQISRQPFIPAAPQGGGQPWEQARGEMKQRRLDNALKTQYESSKVN